MLINRTDYNEKVDEVINDITKGDEKYDAVTAFLKLCGKTFYEYLGDRDDIEIENGEFEGLMSRCMQTLTAKAPNAFMLIFKFFDLLAEKLGV